MFYIVLRVAIVYQEIIFFRKAQIAAEKELNKIKRSIANRAKLNTQEHAEYETLRRQVDEENAEIEAELSALKQKYQDDVKSHNYHKERSGHFQEQLDELNKYIEQKQARVQELETKRNELGKTMKQKENKMANFAEKVSKKLRNIFTNTFFLFSTFRWQRRPQ